MQLSQMLGQTREREAALEARLNSVEGSGMQVVPAIQQLAKSQSELAESLKKDDKKLTLIDNRGIGKPDKFGGKRWRKFLTLENQVRVVHLLNIPRNEYVRKC